MDSPTTPNPAAGPQQVLTQSEVERMLAEVAQGENTSLVFKANRVKEKKPTDAIQAYDFRQPAFLAAAELRKLRLHHEGFIRSLAARVSIYLRLEVALQMAGLQTIRYRKFIESLPAPTHITLFKVQPLRGTCFIDMPPRLALTLADRLLGGPAHSVDANRDLTDIEVALVDQIIQIVLAEWSSHWVHLKDLRPEVIGHESNAHYLQTAPLEDVMLVLSVETRIGDCVEQFHFAFPYYTIEPLVRQLSADITAGAKEGQEANAVTPRWNRAFDGVQIPVSILWGGIQMKAGILADLQPGKVLPLERKSTERVQVQFASVPKYTGQLGTCETKWAVKLTDVIRA
jgi:flagellar motor switch protein FliM